MSGADPIVPLEAKSPSSPVPRRAIPRWVAPAFTVVLLCLIAVFALRPGVTAAAGLAPVFHGVTVLWCLAAAGCQAIMYICLAGIIRAGLEAQQESEAARVPLLYLTGSSAAFLWANRALPGPAVAGLATLVFLLGRRGIPAAVAQASAALFYVADYVAFAPLCIAVLLALSSNGQLAGLHFQAMTIALGLIAAGMVGSWLVLKSPSLVHRIIRRAAVALAVLTRRPDRDRLVAAAEITVQRFYSRWSEIAARPLFLARASAWSLLMHLAEIATIWCAMHAFASASSVLPGGAITREMRFWDFGIGAGAAYVAGNLAAIVSFLPAGLGFFEGAMVTSLHLVSGLTVAQAALATAIYRILSVWLPLPFVLRTARHAVASASALAGRQMSESE